MFARSSLRAARPLRMLARRYATETPGPKGEHPSPPPPPPPAASSSSSSSTLLYVAGGAALAGAGYWYVSGTPAAQQVKQAAGGAPRAAFTGGDQGFVSLKLAEVETVNHNTKRLRFELPEGDMVSGLHVASAILTKYKGPNDEKPTLRPYTPISDEGQQGYLDLLVKKYPDGPMSSHLHAMAPGQRLEFKGPLPKYAWAANRHEHIALIAGGTGITPMYQLLRAVLANPDDRTRVTLVFGNLTEDDMLLRRELAELENRHPRRFRAFYTLDRPPRGWQGGSGGHITKDLLKTVLPEPAAGDAAKIFVCGPPGLMKAISGAKVSPKDQGELDGALKELGYSKDQVYKF
ncbi:hypothetical protein CDD83_7360 [Cordyceps sp. RAO-2017]|nr:hypothetical protein CDD83_7360 [Cordyceps sp. RAO-2017]